MQDVKMFLSSEPISPTIDEIKQALNVAYYVPEIHNPDQKNVPDAYSIPFSTASVLLALLDTPDNGIQVLLTQRSEQLRHHPGQISFPGGKMDDEDNNVIHTALREAEEEVGLKAKNIQVIGQLGDYFTTSGFCVSPVVAQITNHKPMIICYEEVQSVHWVPLDYLLNPANFRFTEKVIDNKRRGFFEIHYQDLHIWGVTAGIIYGLYAALTSKQ
ncbi:CoA pyrophosphatase [Marinomonas agarivorans]|nr:CoA pyrophosphatase [Marinomonas agarivorans]